MSADSSGSPTAQYPNAVETHRIVLRGARVVDAPALAREANDFEVYAGLQDHFPHPYTVDDGLRFIELMQGQTGPRRQFVIEVDGEPAGIAGLFPQTGIYRHNAELGYWIGRRFWGRGIMTEVVARLVELAWERFPVDRLYARVFGSNIGSIRVLQKAGFEVESRTPGIVVKNGQRLDEVTLALRRDRAAAERVGP